MKKINEKQQAEETLRKADMEDMRKCSEEIYASLVKYNCKQVPQWVMTGTKLLARVLIISLQPGESMPQMMMMEPNESDD